MGQYYIGIQPKDKSENEEGVFLEDFSSKEELFDHIDEIFPKLAEKSRKCPKCGSDMTMEEDDFPKGWFCRNDECDMKPVWSDEVERDVIYSLEAKRYDHTSLIEWYQSLLQQYGYVTSSFIKEETFDFIRVFDDAEMADHEDAFIAYLNNMMFDADKHDIDNAYSSFKGAYIGYAGTSDDDRTEEWLGEWLVDNDYVSVPDHLDGCVDYAELASDYLLSGSFWHSDGYVFQD